MDSRRIRYLCVATATPPPSGNGGSAQQSPRSTAHGLKRNDDDVFYDAMAHSELVAAVIASELAKERGGNVATDDAH